LTDRQLIEIDAAKPGEAFRDILDEINAWKIYSFFGERPIHGKMPENWLKRIVPWLEYIRCPAALGGNYGASIAHDCDARLQTSLHTSDQAWECGDEHGKPGVAARYEPVKFRSESQMRLDFSFFDACIKRLLHSGLKLHFNISSANEWFCEGGAYKYYHWNENPVRKFKEWRWFVKQAFTHMQSRYDISTWRFSCVNEPNCEKKDKDGVIYKVGYRGDETDYARQYCETLVAARSVIPGIRFQMGNYVIRPDFKPSIKPLTLYLAALKEAIQKNGLSFDDIPYVSFSMYEVPYQTIFGATATRFGFLKAWLEELEIPRKPFKIDEFEVHPELKQPYDAANPGAPLDTTACAAAWMAKAVKCFQEQGVVSAAPWLLRLGRFERGGWQPNPKYFVSAMFPLLSGRIEHAPQAGPHPFVATDGQGGQWLKLPVAGELMPAYSGEGQSYRFVEAMATRQRESGCIRVLLFHYHTDLVDDRTIEQDGQHVGVLLSVGGLTPDATYVVTGFCVGVGFRFAGGVRWDRSKRSSTGFERLSLGQVRTGADGKLKLDSGPDGQPMALPRHSVVLLELRPA
jgi:hypothetical protein